MSDVETVPGAAGGHTAGVGSVVPFMTVSVASSGGAFAACPDTHNPAGRFIEHMFYA
ncbi:hypothetical protein [Nocardia testacea]|uniref:hypothetical protein n=1 Tax=Nocardia testacea TaxID=248551 RepID=UPI0002E19BAF|nr:hypothetical protein [Nocardia testacea]